jgi:hypothetical protein
MTLDLELRDEDATIGFVTATPTDRGEGFETQVREALADVDGWEVSDR